MNDEFVEKKKKNEGEMNAGLKISLKIEVILFILAYFFLRLFTNIVRNKEKSTKKVFIQELQTILINFLCKQFTLKSSLTFLDWIESSAQLAT